ncbi:hypothetical protein RRG08_013560 [Elysia crispata]|uniref:Uncharacterized protein n=1 Tax=Elysia crispata TaxID=231223 RepID=A0AAE0Y1C3_9GAST|nr:hypothetical protein RRG08_013560 [Elysia crispata]
MFSTRQPYFTRSFCRNRGQTSDLNPVSSLMEVGLRHVLNSSNQVTRSIELDFVCHQLQKPTIRLEQRGQDLVLMSLPLENTRFQTMYCPPSAVEHHSHQREPLVADVFAAAVRTLIPRADPRQLHLPTVPSPLARAS